MMPKEMRAFLAERLPEQAFQQRLIKDRGMCFMEFGPSDVDQLLRLGIAVDSLGPKLVVCLWDDEASVEIGGYLVIDNLAMGRPSMGGIRMLPDITPATVRNLARGMTLKNAAAHLPYGGGKAGIVADPTAPSSEHARVIAGFARLIKRYTAAYLPGPDVGTNDADMKTIAIENGLDNALSKPLEMGGNRIDELGAAAGGIITALDALLKEMPRLRVLPQFARLHLPPLEELSVLIQGAGAVGVQAARILQEKLPGAKVVGISDVQGYLHDAAGLPIDDLFHLWKKQGIVTRPYFLETLDMEQSAGDLHRSAVKYSSAPDDLLRESAFCFIPAAPIANYLDIVEASLPTITVDVMGHWSVIVEGANTYSPDAARRAARARMEREVYSRRGVLIAPDYLVNSGGVIYAAHERLIETPAHLRIPEVMLGDREAIERWLDERFADFVALAQERVIAAERLRDEAIRYNVRELVDALTADPDLLPCTAAEHISIRRIAARESSRQVADIMAPIRTIDCGSTVQEAAQLLMEEDRPLLVVLGPEGELAGVVTQADLTRAVALGTANETPLSDIITGELISTCSTDGILDVLGKLEHYGISSMPVIDDGVVKGLISSDLLVQRSLISVLQTQLAAS